jgi:hypothetical protein
VVGQERIDQQSITTKRNREDPIDSGRRNPMCDYSLHEVASRPAKVGDKLVSTSFSNAITRGFSAVGEPGVAVCLLPGTELAFEREVEYEPRFHLVQPTRKVASKVARFRWIHLERPHAHHDALEFADGQVVQLTRLIPGQAATVLQLPVADVPVRQSSAAEAHEGLRAPAPARTANLIRPAG